MRVIIAGSRDLEDMGINIVENAVNASGFDVTEVVSGTARGADQMGELWASVEAIPVTQFPANWAKFGKRAGSIRNLKMARNADAVIAIWNGRSKGTKNMIETAETLKLKVYIHRV